MHARLIKIGSQNQLGKPAWQVNSKSRPGKIGQENWAGKLSTKNSPAEIGRKKIDKAKLY